ETADKRGIDRTVAQIRRIEGEGGVWWRYAMASRLTAQARRSPRRGQLLAHPPQYLDAGAAPRPRWPPRFTPPARGENLRGNKDKALQYTRQALKVGGNNPRIVRQLVEQVQALAARAERSTEADRKFQHALELAPNVPDVWVAYIRYLSATGQTRTVRDAVDRAKTNYLNEGTVERGLCFEAIGDFARAEEQFKQAVELHADAAVLRAVASFYLRLGVTAKADPYLDQILRRTIKVTDADIAWAQRAHALVLASGNDFRKFQKALTLVGMKLDNRTGLAVEVSAPTATEREETMRTRARVLASSGIGPLRKQAIEQLKDLETRGRLQPDDRYLLAELYEAGGERSWTRARDLLRILAAEHKNPDYLSHLAQSLLFYKE